MTKTLKGNALREYKQTITLNPMQREIIVGTLLGDASIPMFRGKPTLRVTFEQTIKRENYIWHLYDIFQDFVGTPPRVRNNSGGGAQDRQSIWFCTYGHPDFKFYYDLFYPALRATRDDSFYPEGGSFAAGCARRIKRVPENIHELLTPRALAYWFMDDGDSFQKPRGRAYRFSTHSFPFEDQKTLIQALQDNFSISATIQKHYSYYTLYIRSKSTQRFVELIRPYIHPCFDYKI